MSVIKPTLSLGNYDSAWTVDSKSYLSHYHKTISGDIEEKYTHFRDENINTWKPFKPSPSNYVEEVQIFLKETGFLYSHEPDGIFGYETLSAVRLFQEYLRTVEKRGGIPDGIIGKNSYAAMDWWKTNKQKGVNYINDWGKDTESKDYSLWMEVLRKGKAHYLSKPSAQLKSCESCNNTDTIKVANWQTDKNAVHLIGIRRKQKKGFHLRFDNVDLYVLVLYGMVFYFWGSTVPSVRYAGNKKGESKHKRGFPFLFEGQHRYQFAWHLVSSKARVYKALRPASAGILAYRVKDKDKDNDGIISSQEEMNQGLDTTPNGTINIHWSGRGTSSFSAGCQVIAGGSYINHLGELINCMNFAATNSGDLNRASKTKGAYNILADLILTYSKPGLPDVNYTLFREEELGLFSEAATTKVSGLVTQMKQCLK